MLFTFQREGWESQKDHGWAPKRLFRDGNGTLENTQPSQIGGRRDEERGESIEGEEKDWISDFPQSWMIVSICVCVAAIVMFDLNVFQLESECYSLSFNRYMLKYFLVLDQVFPSSTKEVVYHK